MATWYDQNRVNVTLDKVALVMRKSIVAIEDYRFYQHGALDLKGTLRAFITNQASSDVVQGGSSITQQMVKQTLINQADSKKEIAAAQDDTYERKIRELKYAIAFEQNYSKDWILERYLNVSYFGDGAYGIEAAARHYFTKPASRLNAQRGRAAGRHRAEPEQVRPHQQPRRGARAPQRRARPDGAAQRHLAVRGPARDALADRPRRSPRRRTGAWASTASSSATTCTSTSSPTPRSAATSTSVATCSRAAASRSRPR